MSNVLTQTIVYVILLFAGYGFKKAGIFKVEDTDFLKKVILYLTMPAMAVKGGKGSFSLKFLLKKIFTSPITDMYLLMILLAALHLRLPDPILKLASVMGNANAFLAMLSIGILFELNLEKKNIRDMVKFFVLRYGTILLIMAGVILLIPFSQDIRQAICVLLMAPVASIAPLLTMNAGGDGAKAAQINSVSILIGIAGMMVVYALV